MIGYSKEQQIGKRESVAKRATQSNKPLVSRKPMKKVSKKQAKEHSRRRKSRKKLESKSKGKCQECGEEPDWRGLQMHHIEHLSQGGKTVEPNLVLLCARCHSEYHHIKEL